MIEQQESSVGKENSKNQRLNVIYLAFDHAAKGGISLGVGMTTFILSSRIIENFNLSEGNLKTVLVVAPITGYVLEYVRQSILGIKELTKSSHLRQENQYKV